MNLGVVVYVKYSTFELCVILNIKYDIKTSLTKASTTKETCSI